MFMLILILLSLLLLTLLSMLILQLILILLLMLILLLILLLLSMLIFRVGEEESAQAGTEVTLTKIHLRRRAGLLGFPLLKRVFQEKSQVKIQLINGPRAARQQTAIFQLPTTMIIRKTHSPAMIQARLDHPEYFLNQYNLHSINQHGHNLFLLYHFYHNQHCLTPLTLR